MVNTGTIWSLLDQVDDPEVPVLSVVDLGIVREVRSGEEEIEIIITPTYSGCPAMDVIRMNIRMKLLEHGYADLKLTTVLSPAWTTDWMSERGKEKLLAYGIAPPLSQQQVCHPALFHREEAIACPHCHSHHTSLISEFGSTACKALYRCEDCGEPFDYFKCH
jgi:ring-1,2-phenylacetyl-CoA epoxidase subunit PaaD